MSVHFFLYSDILNIVYIFGYVMALNVKKEISTAFICMIKEKSEWSNLVVV